MLKTNDTDGDEWQRSHARIVWDEGKSFVLMSCSMKIEDQRRRDDESET